MTKKVELVDLGEQKWQTDTGPMMGLFLKTNLMDSVRDFVF